MKSNKKYTNQTFTKRVDHDGGLRRGPKKLADPTVCEKCGAVYSRGRWTTKQETQEAAKPMHFHPAASTVCPACKQIAAGTVGGYLSVDGRFLSEHRIDIDNLIENEVQRAMVDNPLSRIIDRKEADGALTIETTTEHLAQRLGHALNKAFDGDVNYQFAGENKVARVRWHRD